VTEVALFVRDPREQGSPTPLPEDGERSSFRNVVFVRIPDDVQNKKKKHSNSEIHNSLLLRSCNLGHRHSRRNEFLFWHSFYYLFGLEIQLIRFLRVLNPERRCESQEKYQLSVDSEKDVLDWLHGM
jgi:hypothetical protein